MSGIPESNWLLHLGKVAYYRCTNPAHKGSHTRGAPLFIYIKSIELR